MRRPRSPSARRCSTAAGPRARSPPRRNLPAQVRRHAGPDAPLWSRPLWSWCACCRARRCAGVPDGPGLARPGRGQRRAGRPAQGTCDQPGRADADATNAFLVGGIEPPSSGRTTPPPRNARPSWWPRPPGPAGRRRGARRAEHRDPVIHRAIELARANNRQGLPLGAQYLRNASAELRTDALPLLESLTTANQQRVQTEFELRQAGAPGSLLTGVGAGPRRVIVSRRSGWPAAPTAS